MLGRDDKNTSIRGVIGRVRETVGSVVGRVVPGGDGSSDEARDKPEETNQPPVPVVEEEKEEEVGQVEMENPAADEPSVPDRSTLETVVDRSSGTVVVDADLLLRLDDAANGQEMLRPMAEVANVVVPQSVRDELDAVDFDDMFEQVGELSEARPSETLTEVCESGKIAIVEEIPMNDLCSELCEEVDAALDGRVADNRVDLRGDTDTGGDQIQTGTPAHQFADDDVVDLIGERSELRLRMRGTHRDGKLGPGESGTILLADALDATFVGNDWDARTTAGSLGIGTAEFYATLTELVASGRLQRAAADGLLGSLHSKDDLPHEPVADQDPAHVTLPGVLDDLPDDITHWSFAVLDDGLVDALDDGRFESVLAGTPVEHDTPVEEATTEQDAPGVEQ